MKKLYTLVLSIAVTAINLSAAPTDWKSKLSLNDHSSKQEYYVHPQQHNAPRKSNAQTNKLVLPGKLDIYESFNDGASWELMDSYKYTYENGLVVLEEYNGGRTSYKYDEHGNWIEKITQVAETGINGEIVWVNSEKNVREFDEIIPTFQTVRQDLMWNTQTQKWEQYYKHHKIVTRNKHNLVDAVIIRSYLNETQYADIEGFRVIYDFYNPTNVIAITEYSYDYDLGTLSAGLTYQEFVWDECGQILNIEYLCLGDVRAKSYEIVSGSEIVARAEITYNTDGLFSCKKVTTDAIYDYNETYTFEYVDNYGSYDEAISAVENGKMIGGERLSERYDQFDTQLDYLYEIYDGGEWVLYDRIVSTPTYDGNKLIESVIQMTNPDTMELETTQKYNYSDFLEAGISDIENSEIKATYNPALQTIFINADSPVAYSIYSVDGRLVAKGLANEVLVDQLYSGLYILQIQGSNSLKFIK